MIVLRFYPIIHRHGATACAVESTSRAHVEERDGGCQWEVARRSALVACPFSGTGDVMVSTSICESFRVENSSIHHCSYQFLRQLPLFEDILHQFPF